MANSLVPSICCMRDSIKASIKADGFPAWRTLRWTPDILSRRQNFSLVLDSDTRSYKAGQVDPQTEFDEAKVVIHDIREILGRHHCDDTMKTYIDFTSESMAEMIFSSNENEQAGLSRQETLTICDRIFHGELLDPTNVDTKSSEFEENLNFLKHKRRITTPDISHVIKSRREVIQHAQALKYITDAALHRDWPLSEELILETHRILCEDIELDNAASSNPIHYAGRYRTIEVSAGGTLFTAAEQVPREMGTFIQDFNKDVQEREESGNMDPWYLAADVCQDFVTIHPFADGNGRMCRLLMNAYLINYAGVVVGIGEDDAARKEYMEIAHKAGDGDLEEEARHKLARFVLERGVETLRKLRGRIDMVLKMI